MTIAKKYILFVCFVALTAFAQNDIPSPTNSPEEAGFYELRADHSEDPIDHSWLVDKLLENDLTDFDHQVEAAELFGVWRIEEEQHRKKIPNPQVPAMSSTSATSFDRGGKSIFWIVDKRYVTTQKAAWLRDSSGPRMKQEITRHREYSLHEQGELNMNEMPCYLRHEVDHGTDWIFCKGEEGEDFTVLILRKVP